MLKQRLMWIVWPAFLMAGVTEMIVFSMVDPEDISWFGRPLELSMQWVYTCAFFAFWGLHSASGVLTTLLASSPFEVNRCPLPATERPHGCPKQVQDEGACSDSQAGCSTDNTAHCCSKQSHSHNKT